MFQRLRWQLLVTLVGLIAVTGFLLNTADTPSTAAVVELGGIYTEGLAGRVQFINPLLWETNAEHDLVALVFSGLTRVDERGRVVPDLAEDWQITEDGLTYEFRIRENAVWHDGQPVTADDVVFTIGLLQSPDYSYRPAQAALWRTVTVEKVDERTVRFKLLEPLAPFLDSTTLPLLPAHHLAAVSMNDLPKVPFNQMPIGTGPFRLTEFGQGRVGLTTFDQYYGPKPYLQKIIFRLYPDLQSIFMGYQMGEVQGISRLLTPDLPVAAQLEDLAVYSAQQASIVALILNLDRPEFYDPRVRRALLMAIDRQRLIDTHIPGQGVVAHSPIYPGSWAYDPYLPKISYDLERARALLDEAGWLDIDGDGIRNYSDRQLEVEILTNDDPTRQAMAEWIAEQWAEIGVHASVLTTNLATLGTQYLPSRQFDVILFGWTQTTADPDPYPLWHSSQIEDGQNFAGLRDSRIDELLESARQTTEEEERRRLYIEFQRQFIEELPALLLYYPVYHYGLDVRVQNVQLPLTLFQPSDRFQTLYRWYLLPPEKEPPLSSFSWKDFLTR